ncbi:TPA: hypothetical protein ACSRG1_000463 [Klebsiella pneumoniae]
MTKSTITREQLEEWVAQFDEDGGCDATDRQLEALIRQSLAAMESEPVAWTWHYREQWHVTNDKRRAEFVAKDGDVAVLPLYRHAHQPVVPDDLSIFEAAIEECKKCDSIDEHAWNHGVLAVIAEYESCRAAMLQGGNSPVIGIDPASGPDRTVEVRYVAPPGYVMVPKEPTKAMILSAMRDNETGEVAEIYELMLATAPQEVKGES